MALHYIIDGYNVIHKSDFLKNKKLKDARNALMSFIDIRRPQGSLNNAVTIVFDGKEGFVGSDCQGLSQVVFTHNQSADEKIKTIVEEAENPKTMIVVTDDRDVLLSCRALGAQHMPVEAFLAKGITKEKNIRVQSGETAEISITEQKKINDELSKLWIK